MSAEDALDVVKCQFATEKPATPFSAIPRGPRKAPCHAILDVNCKSRLNPEYGVKVEVELCPDIAPIACNFFRYLVERDFLHGFVILETAMIGNFNREHMP